MVPVGEDALGLGGGQVDLEPLLHGRAAGTAAHRLARAVEGDQMPGPEVEAVVAAGGVAGRRPEVAVVPGRLGIDVVVVPGDRPGADQGPSPGRGVTVV